LVGEVTAQLSGIAGLDIALNPGDGRLVVIIEDTPDMSAAQTMAAIALLPQVLNTSLVYEYSGPDVAHTPQPDTRYQSWRTSLSQMAAGVDAGQSHGR
jgi:nitrate reductase NapAB chaperone NapD